MPDSAAVASPCTGVCQLNAAELCQGCGRSLAEIAVWGTASEAQRQAIVNHARTRVEQKLNR